MLYGLEGDPVDAGAASIGPNKAPGVTEDVVPAELVLERVEAVGLAWPWHRASSGAS